MSCSNPNLMHVDARYKGNKFGGPRQYEKHIHEFNDEYRYTYDVPCGKCELCLVNLRYEKALRIMLEAEDYEEASYFITLTYNQEHQDSEELDHSHWQQFMNVINLF